MRVIEDKVKKAIKSKKNWNERIEVSRHIADYNGQKYYYVLFLSLFGIPHGAMAIREDGNIPELEQAKEIVWRVSSYNNIMRYANKEMKDDLKRPVGMMKTIEKQVNEVYGEIDEDHFLYKELTLLLNMCETIYRNHEKFLNIYIKICSISSNQEKQQVLEEETFNQLHELFIEAHTLLFEENKMQLSNYNDIPKILEDLEDNSKGKKLSKSLKHLYQEKVRKLLMDFDEGVVRKEVGDVSSLSFSKEDLEEFKALKIKEGYQRFETNLVPDIRN
jgi:hypothetical protein